MTIKIPKQVCAFDIVNDTVRPVNTETLPEAPSEGYRWLHFDHSEPELESWLRATLPYLAAAALLQNETRPTCEEHGEGLILNLRGVNLNPGASPSDMVSIRLWVTTSTVISVRRRKVWAVDAMRQTAETGKAPKDVGAFLAELSLGLAKRIESVSLELEDETDELEEKGIAGNLHISSDVVRLRQTLIKLRRYVSPQRDALDAMANHTGDLLDASAKAHIKDTANRTRRTLEELDASRERLTALNDHLDSAQTNALSKNSYVLSVVAAIFLPLGFLTGLFGVNVAGMPGVEEAYAFWALTLASIAIGVALFVIFRILRWL